MAFFFNHLHIHLGTIKLLYINTITQIRNYLWRTNTFTNSRLDVFSIL